MTIFVHSTVTESCTQGSRMRQLKQGDICTNYGNTLVLDRHLDTSARERAEQELSILVRDMKIECTDVDI